MLAMLAKYEKRGVVAIVMDHMHGSDWIPVVARSFVSSVVQISSGLLGVMRKKYDTRVDSKLIISGIAIAPLAGVGEHRQWGEGAQSHQGNFAMILLRGCR
jgi:hypothetical protein